METKPKPGSVSNSWPKSVLVVMALLVFVGQPILGDQAVTRIALGIVVLWFLIGPGFRYSRALAARWG